MSSGALKVLAVLANAERTETEIAISAGLSLAQVRSALDELLITDGVREQFYDGLRLYSLGGNT